MLQPGTDHSKLTWDDLAKLEATPTLIAFGFRRASITPTHPAIDQ